MSRLRAIGIAGGWLLLAGSPVAWGQTVTNFYWTGLGGDSLWSNPANWDRGEIPNGTWHHARFDGSVSNEHRVITVDTNISISRLVISATSGSDYVFNAADNERITFVNGASTERTKLWMDNHAVNAIFNVDIHGSTSYNRYYVYAPSEMIFNNNLTTAGGTITRWYTGTMRVRAGIANFSFQSTTATLIFDTPAGVTNTYNNTLVGTGGAVRKEGEGLAIISGAAKTYDAATVVAGGRLDVNTTITNSAYFLVADGGLLAGTGLLSATTVEDHGILAAGSGAAAGTLTLQGLVFEEQARLRLRLGAPEDPHDRLHVAGDLTLDGRLDVTDAGGFEEGIYTLITYTGTLTNLGLQMGTMPDGFAYQIRTDTPGEINLVVIPEPMGLMPAAGILLWLLYRRQRRIPNR